MRNERVIYFAHPIFGMFQRHGPKVYKQFVLNSLALLLPQPMLKTNAPTTAQVTITRQERENRHIVHVLHYIPERRPNDMDVIEDALPLHDVALSFCLRLHAAPARAYLAPQGTALAVSYADGYASVVVPEVVGHQMVVFEGSKPARLRRSNQAPLSTDRHPRAPSPALSPGPAPASLDSLGERLT